MPEVSSAQARRIGACDPEPLTEELLAELLDAPSVEDAAAAGARWQRDRTLAAYLQQLLEERGLDRAAVVREAGLNATFGYQIFTGQRGASRDKVLQLAFALHASLREANRLLRAAGASALSPKSRRDVIVIYCLSHGRTLQEADEELYRFGEDTIC